ncbi:MAG UNVERIFIED_CONTAM: hypothetical protein LVR18_21785 [Planctomycetaceae bacterium]
MLLGHRRLAIVDLSDGGRQPMQRGHLTIVFNGEIFNHLELRRELEAAGQNFISSSDTEVLLASYEVWGRPACIVSTACGPLQSGTNRIKPCFSLAIALVKNPSSILFSLVASCSVPK